MDMARQVQAPNIHHFWDPEKLVSGRYSSQFNWNETEAWDVYLFFRSGQTWSDSSSAPSPHVWFHQRAGVERHQDKQFVDWRMRKRLQNIIDNFIMAGDGE